MSFFDELKRRNVFKVGVAYLVSAWLLIQVVDILLDNIGAPAWVLQTLFVVLGVGFFITLFFAWAFEMTPDGVKREKDVDRSQSITPQTGKKLNNTILVLMALAIAYLLFDKFSTPAPAPVQDPGTSETVAEETPAPAAEPVPERQSIAVLPFENRSNREEDQFFTDGIHDDLLTTIARIGSMKVISRTSVMEYKGTTKKIPEIAKELGVANILEGGIQRSGNQVRINVQLIDAETDEHLWAEIYDRELTAENLFTIQSEISKSIAGALQTTLSPQEQQRINRRPTDNLLAYDAYLRGRQLNATRNAEKLVQAVEEFNRAVELDPEFALAWVGLADATNLAVIYGTQDLNASVEIRENAIEQALKINDQLGEAYTSLGSLYDDINRPQDAELAWQKAIELSPNYATAYHWYANFLLQYPLRTQESVELATRASELDPRSMIIGSMLGAAYGRQGLFSLSERQFKKVVELYPDFAQGYQALVQLYTFMTGQFDKAMLASRHASELNSGGVIELMLQAILYLEMGDLPAAENARRQIETISDQGWRLGWVDLMIAQARGNPQAAREAIQWLLPKVKSNTQFAQYTAMQSLVLGDVQNSRDIFVTVNPGWVDPEQWQSLINRYQWEACAFSWVLIHTGDEELGKQLLQQTTRFIDVDMSAVSEHVDGHSPEVCYLTAGDTGKALDSLETQLEHNHLFNWDVFHGMPMYEAIRFEPRYQAVMAERKRRITEQRQALEAMEVEL
jgi:TolB-like protein/Tfp pilus assembly protein PilF